MSTEEQRTVPVALRFEASPGLQHSLNELIVPRRRQLGGAALYFYIAGNGDLPVILSGIDGIDDSDGAKQTIDRYNNTVLSKPIKGVAPYHRQFPIAGIEHHSSEDGLRVNFAIRLRASPQEMNQLRRKPFDVHTNNGLTLPYSQPQPDMQPLSERIPAYRELRQKLGQGILYVTHPTAITLPPHVDQYSKF